MSTRTAHLRRWSRAGAVLVVLVAALLDLGTAGGATRESTIPAAVGSHHDRDPARSTDLRRGPARGREAVVPSPGRSAASALHRSSVPMGAAPVATPTATPTWARRDHAPPTASTPTAHATSSRGPPAAA